MTPETRLEIERDAIIAYVVIRECFFPDSHNEALKQTLSMLKGAQQLREEDPDSGDYSEDGMRGEIKVFDEVWRTSPEMEQRLDRKKRFDI